MDPTNTSFFANSANWLPIIVALSLFMTGFICSEALSFVRWYVGRGQSLPGDGGMLVVEWLDVYLKWCVRARAALAVSDVANPYSQCRPNQEVLIAAEILRDRFGGEIGRELAEMPRVVNGLGEYSEIDPSPWLSDNQLQVVKRLPMCSDGLQWLRDAFALGDSVGKRRLEAMQQLGLDEVQVATLVEEAGNDDVVHLSRRSIRLYFARPLLAICVLTCILSYWQLGGTNLGFGVFFGAGLLGYEAFVLQRACRRIAPRGE